MIPHTSHYWLKNAQVPRPLLSALPTNLSEPVGIAAFDNLVAVDLEICDGIIRAIQPANTCPEDAPVLDMRRGMVWCCLVDMHTHFDKGHTWGRAPNRTGSFSDALEIVNSDRIQHWTHEDVYRRMEFAAKCSYAHGTIAIRTHIDSSGEQGEISFSALKQLQQAWAGKLTIQGVSLVPIDYFMTPEGEALADLVAEVGGVLGGVTFPDEALDTHLDRVFTLAKERNLNLDFHSDESGNPTDVTLRHVAAAALRHEFSGQVVCGHCCSLAVQSPMEVQKTIALVRESGIGIVSLPMCNLYLQDRNQVASRYWLGDLSDPLPTHTPRWRGITLIHELTQAGVPVAIASDNCRDPFYAFGDHDVMEVFTQGVRIAQLDAPYGNWSQTVTRIPAELMQLPTTGRIEVGLPADLILFKARYFSELLSRSQHDRIVLRKGQPIDTTLPDYADLDDLL